MGREIRRVPKNWQHPRDEGRNGYKPLKEGFKEDKADFIKEMTEWTTKFTENPEKNWSEYIPYQPEKEDYMPSGSWYQLFENVSEGTPLSPPFATKKELVEWLSNNDDFWGHSWTPEQAAAMVEKEYAPSGVFTNGRMYSSEESVLL